VLTVNLEDYFQVAAFQHLITSDQWYRFETRLNKNVERTLALLDELECKATFFVLGWIADKWPGLVRSVVEAGHEVASRGFYHRDLETLTREQFREDAIQSRQAIEAATGQEVLGYRMSGGWLKENQLWMLDVLNQEGHQYDSSILPRLRNFHQDATATVHKQETPSGSIWEVPLSSRRIAGMRIPIAGANYFRQFPIGFVRNSVTKQLAGSDPFVLYFHSWELDADQPRINAAGAMAKVRHYRNLDRVEPLLREFITGQDFGSVADYLQLDRASVKVDRVEKPSDPRIVIPPDALPANRKPVSIVVPCYNEEKTIPYLSNTLDSVAAVLSQTYEPHFVLVDDKSTDSTWKVLQETFYDQTKYSLVQHDVNQGVSAAIMTGIRAATSEVVCSIDCDCSYDPHELRNMIPLMEDDVDLVTASPYHPQGRVRNVPRWRLFLSWTLSAMYRILLGRNMYTWTSCCRVYRKSVVGNLNLEETGFLGTAELVARLCLSGSKIVEHPATLEVRIFGESKMKTVRTIFGHLQLLGRVLKMRLTGGPDNTPAVEAGQTVLEEIASKTTPVDVAETPHEGKDLAEVIEETTI
jgi:polysaccharide deacetylase family protein (PEP-CTERM system associated)